MTRTPTPEPRPRPGPALTPEARRRVRRLAATWSALVLAMIGTLSALVIWHLARRARLIRERLGPPRDVQLPEFEPTDDRRGPPEP